jgi:hypothetical protein
MKRILDKSLLSHHVTKKRRLRGLISLFNSGESGQKKGQDSPGS